MTKQKSKRLLSLLLSLAMVFTLTVTPAFAADGTSSGSEASEASSTSAATFSEPEAVDEDTEADASEEDALESAASDQQEYLNAGISLASTEDGEEEVNSETGGESVNELPEADNSGVITLTEDVALTEQYVLESGTVTIDLNGQSITNNTSDNLNYIIVVNSGATLTIKDSNPGSNTIAGGVYAYGTLNIESGTIAPSTDHGVMVDGNTVTISGGTISAKYGVSVASGSLEVKNDATITGTNRAIEVGSSTSALATISGGTLSGTYAVMNFGGTLNISGGNISGTNTGIYHSSGTTIVTGGTTYGSSIGARVYAGTLTVSDGSISGSHSGVYVSGSTATAKITGGTIGSSSTSYGVNVQSGTAEISGGTVTAKTDGVYSTSAGTTTISSGTINAASIGVSSAGTLTVSGDTDIQVVGTSSGWAYGIYLSAGANATVSEKAVINAVTAEGVTGYTTGIVYFGNSVETTPTTLNISGGTISGTAYGLSGNGSASYSEVNISGGSISGDWGIYHPEMGTLTISGGTITGSTTGIEMRSGTLNVTGGTIESTYTGTFATENNGSGTTVIGAGIAVSQHTTDNAITVNISGGEISGIYGVYEINYNTSNTSSVSVNVTEDEDGSSATITTTDSTQGAAVYSTSLDDTSTSTAKNNNTSVKLSAGTYNTDVSAYTTSTSAAVATTTTTDEDGNTTTVYEVVTLVDDAVAIVLASDGSYKGSTASLSYISDLADGCTVQLIADVSEKTFTLRDDITVTLDLNGHNITCTDSSSYPYSPIYVTSGSLTVIDSTAAEGEVGDSVLSTTKGNGAVFVTGGNVTIEAGNYISYSSSGQTVQISKDATSSVVTINNGTFTSVGYGMQVQAGTLNINGGTIASSVTTINGGETTYTPAVRGAVLVRASSTTDSDGHSTDIIPYLNIKEGYFTSIYSESGMIVYAVDKTTDASTNPVDFTDYIKISGGYYDMNNYSVARYLVDGYEVATNSDESTSSTYPYVVQETEVASGSIGYGYATIDANGNVTATIMGTYTDLSGAIYRADLAYDNVSDSGDYYAYVQLGSEVNLSLTSSVGSSTTYPKLIIDLNGASISSTATVFQVGEGSELIIVDSMGTATVTSSVKTAGTLRNAGGTLTVYGGTFSNTDTDNSYSPVIYNAVASSNNGISTASNDDVSTVIYGGTFESKGRAIHLNLGTAKLNGGTYTAKALYYQNSADNTVSYPDGYNAFVTNTDSSTGTTYYTWNIAVELGVYNSTATVPGEVISGEGESVMYVKVSGDYIGTDGYYSTSAYPTTSLTYTVSENSNDSGSYIFAGWYTLEDGSYTAYTSDMWSSSSEDAYYAKFVDANALSVQCMFTYNVSGYGNIWRFFTSINGQDMDGVIFKITNTDGTEITTTTKATHAYTKYTISGTSPSTVFTPDLFSSASTYILTSYYTDSNQELGTCKVKACWITLDGTTVEGSSYQFTHSSVTGKLESAE